MTTQLSLAEHFWQRISRLFSAESEKMNSTGNNGLAYKLDDMGTLRIVGPDSVTFLQGQLTTDVEALPVGEAEIAGHCDHKGRLRSNFFLARAQDNEFLMFMLAELCESAAASLKKYAVFSRCEVEVLSDCSCLLASNQPAGEPGLWGNTSDSPDKIPANYFFFSGASETQDFPPHFYWFNLQALENLSEQALESELIFPTDAATLSYSLESSATWHYRRLRNGIALLKVSDVSEHIPQMLNMDQLRAISWTKGCYTGQEIIARLKYRGSINRRLFIVEWCETSSPKSEQIPSASPMLAILNEANEELGETVEVIRQASGDCIALAVVKLKSFDQPTLDALENGKSVHITLAAGKETIATGASLSAPKYLTLNETEDREAQENGSGDANPG